MNYKPRRTTEFIVIEQTGDTKNIGRKEIDRQHRAKGSFGIGYHFVIRKDGEVEQGRELEQPGAMVEGYTDNAILICVVGQDGIFSRKQKAALKDLLNFIQAIYPDVSVLEHFRSE